ncbi:SusD/RagB family nutrient-binding outer membrane lipoprotein [Muricauda sp. 2012CJ35-5]|uniref:SusD/RagB family nutrient-binding outer membrane lipoprotein n=1 Tax=Flagellimonas spongiicola TaxID=2942208 RepID=A0ABT0PNT1_9FLAO|nr:SusD/RagB family nutrient-binding outer membrane lipoprotein [Allomuricauda spongiicola]MCL6272377.1 SusD/RagB family nutrient-binding outer membrane lipoprotein [Allomuricauda spongiicola]
MKIRSKHIIRGLFAGVLILMTSCEVTELDLTNDPNFLTPEQASPDFFISSIQEDFARHLDGDVAGDPNDNFVTGGFQFGDGLSPLGMELTRVMQMSSRDYESTYQDSDVDDEWDNAYRGVLFDIRLMTPLAEEAGLTRHLGIAQFIEAYIISSLVDFFGDIPYTEAVQAPEIVNPILDSGQSVYQAAQTLLDQAIVNFTNTASATPAVEFFYNNDYSKWVKAANTLKMKLYLQTRLVDPGAVVAFNAIVNSGDFISDSADDFDFQWPGTSAAQPDNRHPRYGLNYVSNGPGDYASNWLMNQMMVNNDPRMRYYFYRQTNAVPGVEIDPDEQTLRCSLQTPPAHYTNGGFTFCNLPNGYWGRDHGDDEGTPPDGPVRTTWGVYPAGGRFDDDSFSPVAQPTDPLSNGGGGLGITPILDAFMVDFWRAEMALVEGNTAVAQGFLEAGMTKQIAKVTAASAVDPNADLSFEPSATDVTDFINTVVADFAAATGDDQWNILAENYFVSHYGNGIETYNFYRRTGFPNSLQPNREPDPGSFPRSMFYPNQAVTSNSNITQKANLAVQVFWDNNPAGPTFPASN